MMTRVEPPQICHAGTPHPHDAIARGPFGALCSICWARLLALPPSSTIGNAARAWEIRQTRMPS